MQNGKDPISFTCEQSIIDAETNDVMMHCNHVSDIDNLQTVERLEKQEKMKRRDQAEQIKAMTDKSKCFDIF